MGSNWEKLLTLLGFVKPRQNNSGAGSVQVERAAGEVRVKNVTQHQPTSHSTSLNTTHHAPVTHVHVTHIYPAAPAGTTRRVEEVLREPPPAPAPIVAPFVRPVAGLHDHWERVQPKPAPAPTAAPSLMKRATGLIQSVPKARAEALKQKDRMSEAQWSKVLVFMRREFNTSWVNELDYDQCHRVRRYAEEVLKNSKRST